MKKKLCDCDIVAALQEVVNRHVRAYQSDFDVDKSIFSESAVSENPHEKVLLWLARPHGTHCFPESDVFIEGTHANHAWLFYNEETKDPIVAYAIELKGIDDGIVKGTLYELDYAKHCDFVRRNSFQKEMAAIEWQDGKRSEKFAFPHALIRLDALLGEVTEHRHKERYKAMTISAFRKQYNQAEM